MSKIVGLKILLTGGHFLQVAMMEGDARSIITGWATGKLQPILSHADMKSPTGTNQDWAVKTDQIVALHTFEMAEGQQGRLGQMPPGRGGSGLGW